MQSLNEPILVILEPSLILSPQDISLLFSSLNFNKTGYGCTISSYLTYSWIVIFISFGNTKGISNL